MWKESNARDEWSLPAEPFRWNTEDERELSALANPPEAAKALSPSERRALAITSAFETGASFGFGGLTGDFDGQGISFGLMQWNFGSGSLIPLLKAFATEAPDRFSKLFGLQAPGFLGLIFSSAKDATARQLAFAKSINKHDGKKWRVVEPWNTYFNGLAEDAVFQKIEIRYAKIALDRAAVWCRKLGLTSERSFVFMFDTVSAHGPWWLDAPKFKGARVTALNARLADKKTAVGGRALTDTEKLEVIGNMLADFAREKYRDNVRIRKMWFVRGRGKIHGTEYDLTRDFGVTDAPFTTSGSASAVRPASSSSASVSKPAATPARTVTNPATVEETIVTPVILSQLILGERDASKLASEAYYALHPERKRSPIRKDEPAEAAQWKRLRDGVVTRLLANFKNVPAPPKAGARSPGAKATPAAPQSLRASDASRGTTIYTEIPLGSEAPANPLTGIFMPSGFRSAAEVDIILYLHGHKTERHYSGGPKMQIEGYWSERTTPRVALREAVEASGKNVILVAPTLGPTSAAGSLVEAGGLDAYLARVLGAVAKSAPFRGRPAPKLRHLVLAAHSGGGAAMRLIAGGRDTALGRIEECWGYDCFYNPQNDKRVWPAWAKQHPQQKLFAYYATDVCCTKVVEGQPCKSYCGPTTIARAIAAQARSEGLSNVFMLSAPGGHFGTVQNHFAERVAGASFLDTR